LYTESDDYMRKHIVGAVKQYGKIPQCISGDDVSYLLNQVSTERYQSSMTMISLLPRELDVLELEEPVVRLLVLALVIPS
jgi:hypothetical protein